MGFGCCTYQQIKVIYWSTSLAQSDFFFCVKRDSIIYGQDINTIHKQLQLLQIFINRTAIHGSIVQLYISYHRDMTVVNAHIQQMGTYAKFATKDKCAYISV